MGSVSVAVAPESTEIVKLIRAKDELGISGTGSDTLLQNLIAEATASVEAIFGRPILRGQYTETLPGTDTTRLQMRVYPIASLDAVSLNGDALTLSDFEIDSRGAGWVYRKNGGVFGCRSVPNAWSVTTTAGWFLDGDNVAGSFDCVASDSSFNSSGLFPVHLKPGDLIAVSGRSDAANNGLKVVATATTSKITVTSALVDEGLASASIAVANIPGQVPRAVMAMVKDLYSNRSRNGNLIEESIAGAVTLRYAAGTSGGSHSATQAAYSILAPFLDL